MPNTKPADARLCLPPSTKKYPYRSLHDFRSIPSYEAKRFLRRTQCNDFEQPTRDIICHSIDSYTPENEELVLKMKTGAHEAAHRAFDKLLIEKLVIMNFASRKLLGVGAKTIHTASRSKEADEAYRPFDLPSGRSINWSTLVIESGDSDCVETLRNNASWWLTASGGDVKVVVTIDIDKRNRWIRVAKHDCLDDGSFHEQSVTVTPAGVSGSPMVFAFYRLFLTPPTEGEGDIEFTHDDFRYLAESIWTEQF